MQFFGHQIKTIDITLNVAGEVIKWSQMTNTYGGCFKRVELTIYIQTQAGPRNVLHKTLKIPRQYCRDVDLNTHYIEQQVEKLKAHVIEVFQLHDCGAKLPSEPF